MKTDNRSDIDFVILWVDPNDKVWQEKKAAYKSEGKVDIGVNRYRDWENLKYWFRAVEKYAEWVRKIHFVTDNQIPEWLNLNNPKLCHVNHWDYIDTTALPVFNSSAIEIAVHRIPGLAEKFVYFNDDMFLTDYVTPEYYFTNGVPNDMAGLTRKAVSNNPSVFQSILFNDYQVLNKYFNKKEVLKKNRSKWFRMSYGKTFIRTLMNMNRDCFDGLVIPHLSVPYLKSDFEKVWLKETELLKQTQRNRFRDSSDLNHFIFRYWRMCEGSFVPRKSTGKYISLDNYKCLEKTVKYIKQRRYPEICINDLWEDVGFDNAKSILNLAFEQVFPDKCSFEK